MNYEMAIVWLCFRFYVTKCVCFKFYEPFRFEAIEKRACTRQAPQNPNAMGERTRKKNKIENENVARTTIQIKIQLG